MSALEIIAHKQAGRELSENQIREIVLAYTQDQVPDYQMAAFLMAVFFQGMNLRETRDLTRAMIDSGRPLDLTALPGRKVDKHSTGGVGDKVSLIVAPLLAALRVPIPMMAGRGLGHTGGTIDKLGSLPGFRVQLTPEEIVRQIQEIGVAIFCQNKELAPADDKIYALRDVTATVRSIPLIVSSILSKKVAEGIDALLMDVKFGGGAFCTEIETATELARCLVQVGMELGLQVEALLTDMDQPLGFTIGNWLEVRECLDLLRGDKSAADLLELSLVEAAYLLVLGGKVPDLQKARQLAEQALESGSAYDRFQEMCRQQGAEMRFIEHPEHYPLAQYQQTVFATQDGYINRAEAYTLGQAAVRLGAGRLRKGDPIDPQAGLILHHKRGALVKQGSALVTLYSNRIRDLSTVCEIVQSAFQISESPPTPRTLILKHITILGETQIA